MKNHTFFFFCVIFILLNEFVSVFSFPTSSQVGQSSSQIESHYRIIYSLSSGGQKDSGNIVLSMIINGDDYFFDNGTIYYYIPTNLTSPLLINVLNLLFPQSITEYFQNHNLNQSIETFFSLRRETTEEIPIFSSNTEYFYSFFWINTTGHIANYLSPRQLIPFYQSKTPYNLYIADNLADLSSNTYQATPNALDQPVSLIKAFHLETTMDVSGDQNLQINLYYDTLWSQLLDAVCSYQSFTGNQSSYNIEVNLIDSSLHMTTISNNPYWQAALEEYIVIGCVSLIGLSIITWILIRRKRKLRLKKSD
jgi:hypothetical protein